LGTWISLDVLGTWITLDTRLHEPIGVLRFFYVSKKKWVKYHKTPGMRALTQCICDGMGGVVGTYGWDREPWPTPHHTTPHHTMAKTIPCHATPIYTFK
jgi:hypothetical protein